MKKHYETTEKGHGAKHEKGEGKSLEGQEHKAKSLAQKARKNIKKLVKSKK